MNACDKCRHYKHEVKNPAVPHVWYNHICRHPLSVRHSFDCVTGETETEQLFCRDVNVHGHCARFENGGSL